MTRCIPAFAATDCLRAAGHTDSTRGRSWAPGYRAQQASPRTVRIYHDGPDEQQYLDLYAPVLRAAGFTAIAEHHMDKRSSLRVTHP